MTSNTAVHARMTRQLARGVIKRGVSNLSGLRLGFVGELKAGGGTPLDSSVAEPPDARAAGETLQALPDTLVLAAPDIVALRMFSAPPGAKGLKAVETSSANELSAKAQARRDAGRQTKRDDIKVASDVTCPKGSSQSDRTASIRLLAS
jgi:hypothetical protein